MYMYLVKNCIAFNHRGLSKIPAPDGSQEVITVDWATIPGDKMGFQFNISWDPSYTKIFETFCTQLVVTSLPGALQVQEFLITQSGIEYTKP